MHYFSDLPNPENSKKIAENGKNWKLYFCNNNKNFFNLNKEPENVEQTEIISPVPKEFIETNQHGVAKFESLVLESVRIPIAKTDDS